MSRTQSLVSHPGNAPLFLIVGSVGREEFTDSLDWLRRHGCTRFVNHPHEAAGFLTCSPRDPDAIIFLQRWTGEFSGEQVLALRRLAPLSPVIVLLDSWCEGETRSGAPIAGAVRIFWYDFPRRMAGFHRAWLAGRCSEFSFPATGGDDFRWPQVDDSEHPGSARVGIYCGRADGWQSLSAAIAAMGYQPVRITVSEMAAGRMEGHPPLDLLLWDDAPSPRLPRLELRQLAAAFPGVPVLALLTFPRVQELRRARGDGACGCVAKPWRWPDLQHEIQTMLS